MKIESTDLSVEKLLQGNYFKIPRFQRPYSWEEENISDFWDDVTGSESSDYFIGSMVVYGEDKDFFGVVDGQQRLTTIMIFLCVLRNAYLKLGEKDKAHGLQGFVERKNKDNLDIFVLKTETSFPFLQETILKFGKTEIDLSPSTEEEALAKAKSIFENNVNSKLDSIDGDPTIEKSAKVEAKIEWLTTIRDVVLGLSIILVILENEDYAYLIFETLNTRGKDLTLSDLVKNMFVRNLPQKGEVDHAKLKWNQVLETIDNSSADLSVDNFIVHSWQSRFESVTKAKTFPRIKSAVSKKTAQKNLNDFISDAVYYRQIFEPSYGWNKNEIKVTNSLEALNLFKVVQPTPAVLSLVRAYRKKEIRLRMLQKALLAIENFHFAFTAVTSSRSSGGISGMYSSFGRKLFEASSQNVAGEEIRLLITKLRERVPYSAEFDVAFEQIIFTDSATLQKSLVRYILLKYCLAEKYPFLGATNELTIEHLIPQESIGEKWPAEIVGQIGNLILVDSETNGKLGTKPFIEKQKILIDRGYRVPEEFLDQENLTKKSIRTRTKSISKQSREKIWKVT